MTGTTRRMLDRVMVVGGLLVVMVQAVFMALDHATGGPPPTVTQVRIDLAIVGFGLFVNQLGAWGGLALFVRRRRFLRLRSEIDHFIDLVRDLHHNRIRGDEERADSALEGMRASVGRIAVLAGSEDDSAEGT